MVFKLMETRSVERMAISNVISFNGTIDRKRYSIYKFAMKFSISGEFKVAVKS